MSKNIFLSSDHGGFDLKREIFSFLKEKNYSVSDLGTNSSNAVDYPDFSDLLVTKMKKQEGSIGVLLCGTGIGMSISANRYDHIRAALCTSIKMASLSRKHNNSNVLVMGGRTTSTDLAKKMIETFLNTNFESGRHLLRVNKLRKDN